ncbi:kinase-like domain-containing protein [Zopfochytrium polystomum]|nr:kinase-like domain-containing protein [Zopfochytrium polystomum]
MDTVPPASDRGSFEDSAPLALHDRSETHSAEPGATTSPDSLNPAALTRRSQIEHSSHDDEDDDDDGLFLKVDTNQAKSTKPSIFVQNPSSSSVGGVFHFSLAATDLNDSVPSLTTLSISTTGSSASYSSPSSPFRYTVETSTSSILTDLSSIWFAVDVVTGAEVVIKHIADSDLAKQELQFLRTVSQFDVPHTARLLDLVPLYDVKWPNGDVPQPKDAMALVLPKLERLPSRIPELETIVRYIRDIFEALRGLHALNICHMDVTLPNLMKDPIHGRAVLIDFGLARVCEMNTFHPSGRGTPGHIAPEVIDGTGCTPVADMYSAGIVFGQWLEPYLPSGLSLQCLGGRLVTPSATAGICERIRDALDFSNSSSPSPHLSSSFVSTVSFSSYSPRHYSSSFSNTDHPSAAIPILSHSRRPSSNAGGSLSGTPHRHGSVRSFSSLADDFDVESCGIKDETLRLAADLLSLLLEPDPGVRITAEEALEHPLLVADVSAFQGKDHRVSAVKIFGGISSMGARKRSQITVRYR